MWLYEEIESAKKFGAYAEFPEFIKDNLNPAFELREYQKAAFCNFITYFENPDLRAGKTAHALFHMATGSGKTLIMAGLMLYLYKKGYRNFLFFVNLSQIVKKTEDNFLNASSSKYLFAPKITIDGKTVRVRKVGNFSDCNKDDINVLFDTTAGLHADLLAVKENAPSIDDFLSGETVLIADEAHHLNADTKKDSELNAEEAEEKHSWENTISKIRDANGRNVMLEFTATCDIGNAAIKEKYHDKIIFNYPLAEFKKDKFSKDIYCLRSDFEQTDGGRFLRVLQALLVSQYKLKLFGKNKILAKPVVLLKSRTIKESQKFRDYFFERLASLGADDIAEIRRGSDGDNVVSKMFAFFEENKITDENLCAELKREFAKEFSIDVNDGQEAEKNQLLVNSLEDSENPYRLIFEVEKLDEGWDCLNLFDIVRLYETRDSKNGKPGKFTVREAQLIGRGARYFPFALKDGANGALDKMQKYMRKFDFDEENPLRVCEQLHYHCQNNSAYIAELNVALREIGLEEEKKTLRHNAIKPKFLRDELYENGFVFLNEPTAKTFSRVGDIAEIKREYLYQAASRSVEQTELLAADVRNVSLENAAADVSEIKTESAAASVSRPAPRTTVFTVSEIIKSYGYNAVYFNASKYKFFTFKNIRALFPQCKSSKEFFTSTDFLGGVKIAISHFGASPSFEQINAAVDFAMAQIEVELQKEKGSWEGAKEFRPMPLKTIFKSEGTKRFYANPTGDGEGVSQSECSAPIRFDTESADWYVYKHNYGTTEEKKFVKHFNDFYLSEFERCGKYSKIYLVRNEGQAAIYAFNNGARFEPDFLLFLKNKDTNDYEYTQIFIEPKGEHLLDRDKWKEDFLITLKEVARPLVQFKSDEKYDIWGFHFYCEGARDKAFEADIEALCG